MNGPPWRIYKTKIRLNRSLGYFMLRLPQHPKANMFGEVYLHRVVMENKLGRLLADGEIVHHKDKNKLNYKKSNLELIDSQSTHSKNHMKERGVTAIDFICNYCNKKFTRYRQNHDIPCNRNKNKNIACSQSCRAYIQNSGKKVSAILVKKYKSFNNSKSRVPLLDFE